MKVEPLLGRRALLRLGVGLALAALGIAWLGTSTNVDLALANAMYDSALKVFPWRHAWLTETFGHGIMKTLLVCAGAVAVLTATWDGFRPLRGWGALTRMRVRIIALSALLVPLVTSLLKQASVSHCPWDLAMYGGEEPYLRLFDALPAGILAGHCLPGGHASVALWLTALGVLWLPDNPRKALAASAAGLTAGLALGWLQQMRGAHFLTHTLWSAWVACAVVIVAIVCLQVRHPARSRLSAAVRPPVVT